MKTTILSLLTLYQSTYGQGPIVNPLPIHPGTTKALGAFQQICTIQPDMRCKTILDHAVIDTTKNPGVLDCSRSYDCCLCGDIECGTLAQPDCTSFIAGDHGVFGVKAVSIFGDALKGGAVIECLGMSSCANTQITGSNILEITCGGINGEYACQDAAVWINEPMVGFNLECPVTGSCSGMEIVLNIPGSGQQCDPATAKDIALGGIECIDVASCNYLKYTINNHGCDRVLLESIECAERACLGAKFTFIGNVEVQSCSLPATGPQPFGIDAICDKKLESLTCRGAASCINHNRQIVDPRNGFEILCEGQEACSGARFHVDISPNMDTVEPVIALSVLCGATDSCRNALFHAMNANAKSVEIEVECAFNGSCNGATFDGIGNGSNNVDFFVTCNDAKFCSGCTYAKGGNMVPCFSAV